LEGFVRRGGAGAELHHRGAKAVAFPSASREASKKSSINPR
jgi:hypothetical protein